MSYVYAEIVKTDYPRKGNKSIEIYSDTKVSFDPVLKTEMDFSLIDKFVPDGILDFDLIRFVSRAFAARRFLFEFDFADLVVSTLELSVTARYRVAILNAIFEYADIGIAFFAHAGDNKVFFGNKSETGQFVASVPTVSGNGINYFLHLELPPIIYFCLSAGPQRLGGSL